MQSPERTKGQRLCWNFRRADILLQALERAKEIDVIKVIRMQTHYDYQRILEKSFKIVRKH